MPTMRERIHSVLTPESSDKGVERLVNLALAALIVVNVVAVILETVEDFRSSFQRALQMLEAVSIVVFSVEYVLRLWTATVDPRFARPLIGRLRYALTPMALVDLVAILPSLIPGGALDLRFARAVRLLRLGRALKIARYSEALHTLGRVLTVKRHELGITALAGLLVLLCAASGIYFAEHEAQPKTFSSIPAALWWGVVTLTTVGYGDVYPVTPAGKMLASVIAVLGIGLFALPAGIVASGFSEEVAIRRRAGAPSACPHCGREIS